MDSYRETLLQRQATAVNAYAALRDPKTHAQVVELINKWIHAEERYSHSRDPFSAGRAAGHADAIATLLSVPVAEVKRVLPVLAAEMKEHTP